MFGKTFNLCAVLCVVLLLGLVIGYSLKPQVKVEVYDQAACIPRWNELHRGRNHPAVTELVRNDPVIAAAVKQIKSLVPLVKAGPFYLAMNPATGDYCITDMANEQPLVTQDTEDDETTLVFWAKSHRQTVDFTYEKGTDKLLRATFSSSGPGGLAGPMKYTYFDCDGDGRFDKMADHAKGVLYEQKGLQWVEWRRIPVDREHVESTDDTTAPPSHASENGRPESNNETDSAK